MKMKNENESESNESEEEDSSRMSGMMDLLRSLLEQVKELQAKLLGTQTEVQDLISDGLVEGMTSDEIREIQELLASDSSIYPEGYTTGYFGSLTKKALKRFQARHELEETGAIDEETRDLMDEYFSARDDVSFPEGFMHAPGIAKKIQEKVCKKINKGRGFGNICSDYVESDDNDNDDDDEEGEDEAEEAEEEGDDDGDEDSDDSDAV